jgi:hypothetical protein
MRELHVKTSFSLTLLENESIHVTKSDNKTYRIILEHTENKNFYFLVLFFQKITTVIIFS